MSPQPDLLFWSDALEQGWGTNLLDQFVLGCWSVMERSFSIKLRELQVICLGLLLFGPSLVGCMIDIFTDNTTALSYVHRQGRTFSPALNHEAQLLLCWAETMEVTLAPQFSMGARNVVADSLSRQDQVIGSEWTLAQEVVDELRKRWLVVVDLFATSLNYRLPIYFSPLNDLMAAGTDAFLLPWDGLQAYTFPPFAQIHNMLNNLRSSRGTLPHLGGSSLAPGVVSGAPEPGGGSSGHPSHESRSSQTAACSSSLSEPPCAVTSCVETV